jgi:predicted nucleotide-binding protein (sugar kinase/HSP70/actin superfamily)
MNFPTPLSWFKRTPSAPPASKSNRERRATLRVGIPKALSVWSTHQFWVGFLLELGVNERNIVFSSDTSEEQFRTYGKGRGTVESCYAVKCVSGHYGELIFGQKKKIDVLLHPVFITLPSFLHGHVAATYACTRDAAAAENIKAGFLREKDVFTENGIAFCNPAVSLAEPELMARQLYDGMKDALHLDWSEVQPAVDAGYRALNNFNAEMRAGSRKVLEWCAENARPCVMVLARPYHMDPGVGHEIESELQAKGFPVIWNQYVPLDDDFQQWLFGEEIRRGEIKSPYDIADVWMSSYSSSTNEIMWGAKVAARIPWVTCVLRLSSYECGMDQPTFTPVQKIVEATGTLYFKFGDLDATKPTGSVKIRTETILHYVQQYSPELIARKLSYLPKPCPLLRVAAAMQ